MKELNNATLPFNDPCSHHIETSQINWLVSIWWEHWSLKGYESANIISPLTLSKQNVASEMFFQDFVNLRKLFRGTSIFSVNSCRLKTIYWSYTNWFFVISSRYDIIHKHPNNYQAEVTKQLVGTVVLTR